jgi:hypothetical protein
MTEDKPTPPKKRSYRKKPVKKPQEPTLSEELDPLFEDALTKFLKTHAGRKNKSLKNIKSLEHLLSQFLNSFILIGYAQDTREFVSLVNARDEQSADSLSAALNKFILNNVNNGPKYPPML